MYGGLCGQGVHLCELHMRTWAGDNINTGNAGNLCKIWANVRPELGKKIFLGPLLEVPENRTAKEEVRRHEQRGGDLQSRLTSIH